MRTHHKSKQRSADSDEEFWPGDLDEWDAACMKSESADNSPSKAGTSSTNLTPAMLRLGGPKFLSRELDWEGNDHAFPESPTKKGKARGHMFSPPIPQAPFSREPIDDSTSADEWDEIEKLATDTEWSPTSTQESSRYFSNSNTSSMTSVDSNEPGPSTSGSYNNRKRPAESIPGVFLVTSSPKFQKTSRDPSPSPSVSTFSTRMRHSQTSQSRSPQKPSSTAHPRPALGRQNIVPPPPEVSTPPDTTCPGRIFGTELMPFMIAHNDSIQKVMDARGISWGVQFEIARGCIKKAWTWEDVTPARLDALKGTNAEAARKVQSVLGNADESTKVFDVTIWRELDREQKAILENRSRGLGLMGEWEGVPDWYGGQIQQLARLSEGEGKDFKIVLEPLDMIRSSRFSRFLGSRHLLQLRIPKDILQKRHSAVLQFLRQKFVLCGRVFIPFLAKENSVYMVETNDDWGRRPNADFGDQHRLSFNEFLDWHNPLQINWKQPMSKWSTRWSLGVSTSVPVLEFQPENIHYIDDIYADGLTSEDNPDAAQTMTDGCGWMNGAALLQIARYLKLGSRPTAVQGRIEGAKGLWMLHPTDHDPMMEPKIWIRASQKKIKYPDGEPLDRAQRIFDMIQPSSVNIPYHVTTQAIMNLSYNQVPDHIFTSLVAQGLQEEVSKLTEWSTPDAMHSLGAAVNKAGYVAGARVQRLARGRGRAVGLHGRTREKKGEDDADAENDGEPESGHALHTGAPVSIFEQVMELILAGFHPLQSRFLCSKLQTVLKLVIEKYVKQFRIDVPESAYAFVVPDPIGVLKEGEIYFRSSQPIRDPKTDTDVEVLEGAVIVGRYPMSVPSDMQKVKAVNYTELYAFPDVIIASTRGTCSLASILSGGDMLLVLWNALILHYFKNTPPVPPIPHFIEDNFERDIEKVPAFEQRVAELSNQSAQEAMQAVLLLGLKESRVGLYSNFHDIAVYQHGYGHHTAIRLARMCETLLDSAKTGLNVKETVFGKDKRRFHRRRPACFETQEQAENASYSGTIDVQRPHDLPQFVFDTLVEFGREEEIRLLKRYDVLTSGVPVVESDRLDADLVAPHQEAKRRAEQAEREGFRHFSTELARIEAYVDACHLEFQTLGNGGPQTPSKKKGKSKYTEGLQQLARRFAEGPPELFFTQGADDIRASYAYWKSPKLGFALAFRQLCTIKSRAGGQAPIKVCFSDTMIIAPQFLRAMARGYEER